MSGLLSAPGGPYMRDVFGRVVLLHGVNAVYKHPPYELYPAPHEPYDFSIADARRIATLGFKIVRLGIIWEGLEPGSAPPNDPSICTPGPAGNPHQLDPAIISRYLAKVKRTVDLLGRYHIYTLLDMHQDLYSSVFGGEGAPPWAVCSDGLPTTRLPGRWSNTYASPGLDTAFEHFWKNDVVGDLQGQYDQVWGEVAHYFRNDAWVVGYDIMNEPFSNALLDVHHRLLDAQIECMYTGIGKPGENADLHQAVVCPAGDPKVGLIPTIEANDPHHLIFYEPDIYTATGSINYIGPMDFSRLVFNFHSYCPDRNPVTGDPTDPIRCAHEVLAGIRLREAERIQLVRAGKPGGQPVFMSEFGASGNPALIGAVVTGTDPQFLGWCYWAWKYYDDPTGSSDEALVNARGKLKASGRPLAEPYPEAVAGTPRSFSFSLRTKRFMLTYVASSRVKAPTIVSTPGFEYPKGYCATASGASVTSTPGAPRLELKNDPGAGVVHVVVVPGPCR